MINYNQLQEKELAELLRNGEEPAFREIYLRHWKTLYQMSLKRLNDAFEAEEVVQDIFCNLWRKRASFVLTTGFNNYFAVAVKFEIINRLAKRSRKTAFEKAILSSFSESDLTTLHSLDFKELKIQLQKSINALPDKCRAVFKLKYEKDYTQHQIAEELRISEKTVEAHLSKARKTLRSTFGSVLTLLLAIL